MRSGKMWHDDELVSRGSYHYKVVPRKMISHRPGFPDYVNRGNVDVYEIISGVMTQIANGSQAEMKVKDGIIYILQQVNVWPKAFAFGKNHPSGLEINRAYSSGLLYFENESSSSSGLYIELKCTLID